MKYVDGNDGDGSDSSSQRNGIQKSKMLGGKQMF